MILGYKKLSADVKDPEMSHDGSDTTMGIDIYTSKDCYLLAPGTSTIDMDHPHPSVLPYANIPTGLCFELPSGVHLSWGGRSGLAFKEGRMAFEGKIDSNYKGELAVKIWSLNPEDNGVLIPKNTKIAQLYIVHYTSTYQLKEVDNVSSSNRGTAGFGSTGS